MKVDLHNHTKLCNHAVGEMDEYVERAIEKEIDLFGFSCHAPMQFDEGFRMSLDDAEWYENEVKRLKEHYGDKIELLLGYEVDFLEGYLEERVLSANVDYLIGSVHFLNKWGFDNPESIFEYAKRDIDEIWIEYFEAIDAMAKSGKFDFVGHIDLIKVFKFLPKNDLRKVIEKALKSIKKSNMAIEINASGLRKPIAEQYPSRDILEMAYELDIPITFGSDAHAVEHIGFERDTIENLAREIGYSRCMRYRSRDRELVTF